MTDWQSLLQLLASGPRENGTTALHDTAVKLLELLRGIGLDTVLIPYAAHPLRLRLAGAVVLFGSFSYVALMRSGLPRLALALAILLPVLILAELDYYVPVFGWIGAKTEEHVEATVPAAHESRRLIFAAHFDSKTDLLDHVERAPIDLLSVPVAVLMLITAGIAGYGTQRRPYLTTATLVLVPIYGIGSFAALTGGAWVTKRSHGALDDGAACAALIRLAERLHAAPPQQVSVRLLFLSAEEIGVHGSWVYAEDRSKILHERPTSVVNLEFIGAAADLGVFKSERFSLSSYEPDPRLLSIADGAHKRLHDKPIYVTWYGASTDARSFLAHGVPALTLFSDLPGHSLARHLHSADDTLARVDIPSLDATVDLLEAMVRQMDAESVGPNEK